MLLFFDRCPALTSLILPQAALGSLSLSRLLWALSCSATRKCHPPQDAGLRIRPQPIQTIPASCRTVQEAGLYILFLRTLLN